MSFINYCRIISTFFLTVTMIGCASIPQDPQLGYYGINGYSIGKDGITWLDAETECNYEASKVSGYDWIDSAINKGKVKDLCLKNKGFHKSR